MIEIETVRKSAKVTRALIVVAAAAILMRYWYSTSDIDYFDMVKAFMQTKAEIGGVHVFFINLAFRLLVVVSVVNAALNDIHGLNIISAFGIPLFIMCSLAFLFIPGIGFTNIHLFWLVCYILIIIGTWLSARQTTEYCRKNSNLFDYLKNSEIQPEMKVGQIDLIVSILLTLVSYILLTLLVIGALIFGIRNWGLISGTDDITPVVYSVRYDIAVKLMEEGEYGKAMVEFRNLESYRDSRAMAIRCEDLLFRPSYLQAVSLMNRGKYNEARSTLWTIYDYRDSADKISQCDALQYDEAIALMGEGLYEEALESLEILRDIGYKDTTEEIDQCLSALKTLLTGTWQGDAGGVLILREDLTCSYVDGNGPTGDGTWDAVDGRLIVRTDVLSYEIYGDLDNGYLTRSVLIWADSSSWNNETFTKE